MKTVIPTIIGTMIFHQTFNIGEVIGLCLVAFGIGELAMFISLSRKQPDD